MGYLTTITIHNDALHSFEKDPEGFAKAIFEGIHEANRERKETSVGFKGYCNYISVQPSRHADDHTLYLHSGNCVSNLNPYNKDFESLTERMPDVAKSFIKRAENIIKMAKDKMKKNKTIKS